MQNNAETNPPRGEWGLAFGFFLELVRLRRWLFVHFVVVATAATTIAFLIPKTYSSSMTFLPPEGGGVGGLSGLLSGMQDFSLGGNSRVSAEQVKSIFEGEQLQRGIVKELRLDRHYKIDTSGVGWMYKAKKTLSGNLEMSSDERMGVGLSSISAFTIRCEDRSPDTAALIVRRSFRLLDSAIRETNVEQARRNRAFIEVQLQKRKEQLRQEEAVLAAFQKKTKIYNAPAQAEATLRSAAELKSRLIEQQTLAEMIRNSEGPGSSRFAASQALISALKGQISKFESKRDADILPGLDRGVDLGAEYMHLFTDVEISAKVVLLLSQQLEMYRIDEARNYSSLAVVSDAMVPDYKSSPKRVLVLLLLLFGEHAFLLLLLAAWHLQRSRIHRSEAWDAITNAWLARN